MSTKNKFHFLLNPVAGNGNSQQAFDKVQKLLTKKHVSFDYERSKYPGHLNLLAKKYANQNFDQNHLLVVIGGDGSLNEVVNGIKESHHPNLPIGYLPAGSGNDFARAANLSNNPIEIIEKLNQNPQIIKMDCGHYQSSDLPNHHQYFVNNVGIGFDAYVVHLSNNEALKNKLNKLHIGNLVYALNIIKALKQQNTFTVDIECNGDFQQFNDTYFATTTNHPYFGGGIAILPKANLKSGVLDLVIVEKPNILKFIFLFIKLLKNGSHVNDPHFHYFEGKSIKIKTRKAEFAQIDGEDQAKKKREISFSISSFNLII